MATPAKTPKGADTWRQDADKLAFVLEHLLEAITQPDRCSSCTEAGACYIHRWREAGLAALAEHKKR